MKTSEPLLPRKGQKELFSELLILEDGTLLAHNLTPTLAALLETLDLRDASLSARVPARQEQAACSGTILNGKAQCNTAKI
jgi:hypothetical protein